MRVNVEVVGDMRQRHFIPPHGSGFGEVYTLPPVGYLWTVGLVYREHFPVAGGDTDDDVSGYIKELTDL